MVTHRMAGVPQDGPPATFRCLEAEIETSGSETLLHRHSLNITLAKETCHVIDAFLHGQTGEAH